MLVLSRKLGQRFQIGPDVRITVVKIDRHSVRIGIEADGRTIYREEIVPLPLGQDRRNQEPQGAACSVFQ